MTADLKLRDRARFNDLRTRAQSLLSQAAELHHIPDHWKAQSRAASNLAGMQLHNVVGEPVALDAKYFRNDIEDIAEQVVNPLIEAIGIEARSSICGSIDLAQFQNTLSDSIDGNATHELSEAANRIDEARDETRADHRRKLQAAE